MAEMEHGFALGGTASSASPSGSVELWWRCVRCAAHILLRRPLVRRALSFLCRVYSRGLILYLNRARTHFSSGYEPGKLLVKTTSLQRLSTILGIPLIVMSSSEFKVTPLEGSINYRTWKFSMRMVLMAKDLWGVVDGSEVKSESGDAEWEKKNQKALAYISLSLTPIEQHHVLDCTTAKAAWDILEKLYEGKGRNRKFLLMEQLFKLNMDGHDTTMDSYLRTMKDKLFVMDEVRGQRASWEPEDRDTRIDCCELRYVKISAV
jgi:gag-polypeptide of LTR copia-type